MMTWRAVLAILVIAVVCDTTEVTGFNSFQMEESALSAKQTLNEIEDLLQAVGPSAGAPIEALIEEDATAGTVQATPGPAQVQQQVQVPVSPASQQQQQQQQAPQQQAQQAQQQQAQQQAPRQQAQQQQASQQQQAPQQQAPRQAPQQQQAPQQHAQQQQAQQPQQQQQQPATKVSKAQEFNDLVTEVNTLLDDAMLKLKKDKELFKKSSSDASAKQSELKEQANSAKQDAAGNSLQINAIETNMQLASKEGAKAFVTFAETFRKSAENKFLKSYSDAESRQSKLGELYEDITSHVADAVKKMESTGTKMQKQYLDTVKAFYKIHYKLKYSCGNEKDNKSVIACNAPAKHAKKSMKEAKTKLADFTDNLHTAHHHGRKLRKRLKHALHKLQYVFQKARKALRHTKEGFHAGFDMHYSAQKAVSQGALLALKKANTDKDDPQGVKQEVKKAVKKAVNKEAKKVAKTEVKKQRKKDAVKKAELSAIHTVQKAAKAILKRKKTQTMMETKMHTKKHQKSHHKHRHAAKKNPAGENASTMKAIGIMAKAITSLGKHKELAEQLNEVGNEEDDFEEEELLQVPKYITSEEDLDAYLKQQGSKVINDDQGVPENELSEQDRAELHEVTDKVEEEDTTLMQVLPEDGERAYRP